MPEKVFDDAWYRELKYLTAEFEVNQIRYKDVVKALARSEDINRTARYTEKEQRILLEGERIVQQLRNHWSGHPQDPFTTGNQLSHALTPEQR